MQSLENKLADFASSAPLTLLSASTPQLSKIKFQNVIPKENRLSSSVQLLPSQAQQQWNKAQGGRSTQETKDSVVLKDSKLRTIFGTINSS
jgi:hypothetical protein